MDKFELFEMAREVSRKHRATFVVPQTAPFLPPKPSNGDISAILVGLSQRVNGATQMRELVEEMVPMYAANPENALPAGYDERAEVRRTLLEHVVNDFGLTSEEVLSVAHSLSAPQPN